MGGVDEGNEMGEQERYGRTTRDQDEDEGLESARQTPDYRHGSAERQATEATGHGDEMGGAHRGKTAPPSNSARIGRSH